MAPHSSVLAWRIPGTREPGGLPSVGSYRVGHDWSDLVVVVVITVVSNSLTPRTAALQASLSFPISQSLFKLTSIELVMPSNHQILCDYYLLLPQSYPASGSFLMSWLLTSGGQSIGASTSPSVLPMNIQGWFPLELTGFISLQSKEFSRVFSNTTLRRCEDILKKNFSLWNPSITHKCAGRLSLSSMRLASLASHYLS